jgi:AraC family transcriptional regulator of adaptative response / methylphosphotriester-DNA alkyltransferase methyltransferase
VAQFKHVLESHMNDFMAGLVDKMYKLKEIADISACIPAI